MRLSLSVRLNVSMIYREPFDAGRLCTPWQKGIRYRHSINSEVISFCLRYEANTDHPHSRGRSLCMWGGVCSLSQKIIRSPRLDDNHSRYTVHLVRHGG